MAANREEVRRAAIAELARRELERREAADPKPERRSFLQQLGRDVGFQAGKLAEGAMSVVTLPIDALGGVINYLETKTQGPTYEVTINGQKFTRNRGDRLTAAQTVSRDLAGVGLPMQPENRTEEVVGNVYRSLGGAAATMGLGGAMTGAASPVASGVGRTLAANPALQTASAVTAPLAAEGAKEMGAGPGGQLVAGLAGAVAPSLAAAGVQAASRGLIRGGEQGRQNVARNLETFRAAGTTPTVGQATEGRIARAAESGLARTPGSAGRMARFAENQADEVGAQLERQAQRLVGRATSAEQTGRAITDAVRGEGGFIERFKQTQTRLWDALDEHVPNTTRVDVSRTRKALEALNASIPGAPNVSRFFRNARIQGIQNALEADINARPELDDASESILAAIRKVAPEKADQYQAEIFRDGKLPYEAIKKLRTMVGREIEDAGIASDVPRSKWRALYAALSDDLGAAVAENPAARSAWTRANNYTRAGMRRTEAIESVIDRNGGPEAIFRAATAGTREGASTLRAVMQSVDDDGRRMITATVLRRLGRAKAGVQGDLGDRFSSETFLTNWNGLSTEAKRTLFNRYGEQFRSDMDQIAKFAANLRSGSQVFRNPSGTAQASAQIAAGGTVGASVMALMTGNLWHGLAGLGGVAGITGGANLSARLMTNPNFVKWLAQSTKVPASSYTSMVNRLAQSARETKDVDVARAAVLLQQQNQGGNNANDQGNRE